MNIIIVNQQMCNSNLKLKLCNNIHYKYNKGLFGTKEFCQNLTRNSSIPTGIWGKNILGFQMGPTSCT